MLDMGGMPSAGNDNTLIRTVNASKNSKLQAVAFDFELLTKSFDQAKQEETQKAPTTQTSASNVSASSVAPDLDAVQQVASLLNVDMDTGREDASPPPAAAAAAKKAAATSSPPGQDIRAKYAAKLKGGLAGIELAKSQVEAALQGGDAAGHLAARQMAINDTAASPSKWMALTGTGKLLSYLTHRSIHIALLPSSLKKPESQEQEQKYMNDFPRQLKGAIIETVLSPDDGKDTEDLLRRGLVEHWNINPNHILVVSDKDDYLKAAKDLGMLTCRFRPNKGRRGNITAHYNTATIPDVQEVVNEINGISFNAVLNR
eukprot:Nitzschia sp. Nitz4//scaffold334_size18717//8732//9679//NITZ4_008762-RA/size18717-processed-gene-0.11-mRNA-1//1//CDS//3329548251//2587//frame0